MSNRFDYKSKLPVNLISDKITELLPEHYVTEYPDLIRFLERYYETLEEDDVGFSYFIQGLYQVKDIDTTLLESLDKLLKEIGNNSSAADFFADPRYLAKVFAYFYKAKGTRVSAEGFFMAFFNQPITVTYPKNNMFIVNESKIGPDSLKFIQDDKRYQIHSILIKSGVALSTWEDLYKKFIHPAGWYLAGDIEIESVFNASLDYMPLAVLDSSAGNLIVSDVASMEFAPISSITGIWSDDTDADLYAERISINKTLQLYSTISLSDISGQYNSIIDFIDENSPTFDQDSAIGVDFSNTLETMDASIYDYWDSANNTFQYQQTT